MRRRLCVPSAALGAALAVSPAAAQVTNASVSCALSGTPLNFGIYSPASPAPTDITATLMVTCTTPLQGPVPVSGTLKLSPGSSGTSSVRDMKGRANVLRYQIYADANHSTVWGNGSGRGAGIPFSGVVGRTQPLRLTFVLHGRLLAMQGNAHVGVYQDVLVATLTY